MPPRTTSRTAPEASGLRTIHAAIQAQAFMPVYYLFGDDDYLKDDAIRTLLDAALDPSTRDFNCEVRRANELDAEAIESLLGTPPMLAARRAVVLRDIGSLKKGARQQLDRYLARPASDTLLLLVAPAGAKADGALLDVSVALQFDPLTPERVQKWIAHHTRTVLKVSITDDASRFLQQAVGNDLHLLAAELDKCASYALGAHDDRTDSPADVTIDADVVSAVVGVRRGETVTDLLDAVAHHDAATALSLIGHVLGQPKVTGVQIVIMLSTQTLALSFGRARRDAGVPTNRLPQEFFAYLKETGGFLGRPWGEAASAWTKVVDQWSARACARSLQLLLEADVALKETTVSNAEQTLQSLVIAMCATRGRRKAA